MISVRSGDNEDIIAGVITAVSVSHRSASVDIIEEANADDPTSELEQLRRAEGVVEAFLLQTCNRAERYVVTNDPDVGRSVLSDRIQTIPADAQEWYSHNEALEHLLRVGTGLESMVVGEDQILGQLRRAWEQANRTGALGPLLDEAVWKSIHLGKAARTETDINSGVRSLSRAAVDAAADHTAMGSATGVILGAGNMAERAAQALIDTGVTDVRITNRTKERAEQLADALEHDVPVYGLDDIEPLLADADILITATSSASPIVTPADIESAEDLCIVDIGQPRDVDPAVREREAATLYDLDDLEAIVAATNAARSDAAADVEAMIEEEVGHLHTQLKRTQADDVIAAMYAGAEEIKKREVNEACNRLAQERDITDSEREIIESLGDAIVGNLMAAPTKSLRDAAEEDDWETIQVALQLFDPEFQSGQVTPDEFTGDPANVISAEDEP